MAMYGVPFAQSRTRANFYQQGANLNIGIEGADCSGAATGGSSPASPLTLPNDPNPGLPGQHAAGGDKLAKHVEGGNMAIQDLGSSGSSTSSTAVAPSSTITPSPQPPTTTPPAIPTTSSISTSDTSDPDDSEDDDCDEL